MQAQTASEQGLAPESIFTKLSGLAVGTEIDISGVPEFSSHEEFGEQASIPMLNGKTLQTGNAKTIGSLKSTVKDSLGDKLRRSLKNGNALKVFVKEEKANTGRLQKVLSIYE